MNSLIIRFKAPQSGDHFHTEQSDGSHQVFLSDIANVELAENGIEHAFTGAGFDLFMKRNDPGGAEIASHAANVEYL